MKVAVFGAGAIGGYLAAKLAAAGRVELSLIARGAHLDAIQRNGLKLIEEGGLETVQRVDARADAREIGAQDYVLLTVKAHSISPALDQITPLLGRDTAVVTMQNGVPWWYFYGIDSPFRDRGVEAVDPGRRIWNAIGPERAIGAVVYPAVEIEAPGLIRHIEGTRFSLGEPDGKRSERTAAIAAEFVAAGLQAPVRTDIRSEIWVKLWGNLAFNPISALTRSTLEDIVADEGTRTVAEAMMREAEAIGAALGVRFPVDVGRRIAGAAKVGAHKTSMLQDLESKRPMEIDALVTAVQELGRIGRTPTPTIDTVLALVRRLAAQNSSV
jgi:2-dehydropantoate 2-reductase